MIKTLYIMWLQGFDQAPDIVKKCLQSWIDKNPTWNIVQLTNDNLDKYIDLNEIIPDIENKNITFTSLSDIIRIALLRKYGGLWVDSTVYCMVPLDEWLKVSNGFFGFEKPGPNRMISSWFLYADLGNCIVEKWLLETQKYWENRTKMDEYFWFHYLFNQIYQKDRQFQIAWDTSGKMPAKLPHFLCFKGYLKKVDSETSLHVSNKVSPLYKLTYKYEEDEFTKTCNLNYVLDADTKYRIAFKLEFKNLGQLITVINSILSNENPYYQYKLEFYLTLLDIHNENRLKSRLKDNFPNSQFFIRSGEQKSVNWPINDPILYLDLDMLVTKPISSLFHKIKDNPGHMIYTFDKTMVIDLKNWDKKTYCQLDFQSVKSSNSQEREAYRVMQGLPDLRKIMKPFKYFCKGPRFLPNVRAVQYQLEDFGNYQYHVYKLPNTGYYFRGPYKNFVPKQYISFIGASQTFGRYCSTPFPQQIEEMTGIRCLNLGIGGAGPKQFLQFINLINQSKLCVLQVMSGRSTHCSAFQNPFGNVDYKIGNKYEFADIVLKSIDLGKNKKRDKIYNELRRNWLNSYQELISKIKVPIILLYVGKRSIEKKSLWEYPQIVLKDDLTKLCQNPKISQYVSHFRVWKPRKIQGTVDRYHFPPLMHTEIAKKLCKVIVDRI